MLLYVSVSVVLAQTVKANVATHHKIMVSTFDGTFTAGPWINLCLPDGSATIFMKGTRREISLCSNVLRPQSSGGTL